MARFGLPGMKVLMFAFGGRVAENPYAPHNVAPRSVIYTGTHDNDTAAGWWSGSATAQERENFALYTGRDGGRRKRGGDNDAHGAIFDGGARGSPRAGSSRPRR